MRTVPFSARENRIDAVALKGFGNMADRLVETAVVLFEHCFSELAYFKAPGWIRFLPALPTTGTQKIQKHEIFPAGTDPRSTPDTFDLRSRKKRDRVGH